MADEKISLMTPGGAAISTDRIPIARFPFGSTDNFYLLPGAIAGATSVVGAAAFNTIADLQAATVANTVESAQIYGYTVVGKGSFTIRRVASQPAHAWKFRSLDRFLPNGSTDNTNGGWWEGYSSVGIITPEMFGAVADGSTNDYAAIQAAIYYALNANREIAYGGANGIGYDVLFPGKQYLSNQTLDCNPANSGDPTNGTSELRLLGHGQPFSPTSAVIYFPTDVTGISIPHAPHLYVTVDGLGLHGGNGNGTAYAIHMASTAIVQNCTINGFSLDGIFGDSTVGGNNLDFSIFRNNRFNGCGRHGIYLTGGDANICYGESNSFANLGGSAIWDDGNFGSVWVNTQIAGTGVKAYQTRTGVQGGVCIGSDGKQYQARPGGTPSTNDPVTDTNSLHWSPCFGCISGSAAATLPTWTSGLTWQPAPAVFSSNNATFEHVYIESGYSPPYIANGQYSMMVNPMGFPINNIGPGMPAMLQSIGNQLGTASGFLSFNNSNPRNASSYTWNVTLGTFSTTDDTPRVLSSIYSGYAAGLFSITHSAADKALTLGWDGHGVAIELLSDLTTLHFGRSAAVGFVSTWFPNGLFISRPFGDPTHGRFIDCDNFAPSAGERAAGDYRINSGVSANYSILGWRTIATGTPGTNQAIYASEVPILASGTVSALPSAATVGAGARGFVTDNDTNTFGSTVAHTTGSFKVPVYSDGSSWLVG